MRLEKCVMAHEGGAMCVNFSPKGDILASSGGDKTVKVWSYPTLEGLRTFSGIYLLKRYHSYFLDKDDSALAMIRQHITIII